VEGLLIAIVDIDEVIQIIRSSDEASAARERLMSIYDLTEIQANYILELRLRQLTKYSRIELEKEQDELRREIEALEAILASDELLRDAGLRRTCRDRREVRHPRRTVLLESEAVSPTVAAALAASVRARRAKPQRWPWKFRMTPAGPCSVFPARSPAPPTRSPWPRPAPGASMTFSVRW
jgi:DNA gyrase subunit A